MKLLLYALLISVAIAGLFVNPVICTVASLVLIAIDIYYTYIK